MLCIFPRHPQREEGGNKPCWTGGLLGPQQLPTLWSHLPNTAAISQTSKRYWSLLRSPRIPRGGGSRGALQQVAITDELSVSSPSCCNSLSWERPDNVAFLPRKQRNKDASFHKLGILFRGRYMTDLLILGLIFGNSLMLCRWEYCSQLGPCILL